MSDALTTYHFCREKLRSEYGKLLVYAELIDKAARRFAEWKRFSAYGGEVPSEFRASVFLAEMSGWPTEDELGAAYRAWENAQTEFCIAYGKLSDQEKATAPQKTRIAE
jgi:hypothetical protein